MDRLHRHCLIMHQPPVLERCSGVIPDRGAARSVWRKTVPGERRWLDGLTDGSHLEEDQDSYGRDNPEYRPEHPMSGDQEHQSQ